MDLARGSTFEPFWNYHINELLRYGSDLVSGHREGSVVASLLEQFLHLRLLSLVRRDSEGGRSRIPLKLLNHPFHFVDVVGFSVSQGDDVLWPVLLDVPLEFGV